METPKADPSIYPKLRGHALELRLPDLDRDAVHVVLMDWHVQNGTVTVLAGADGTASLYLSSGGGFLGGGQKYPEIRDAALSAVRIAQQLIAEFVPTDVIDLPEPGEIFFYVTTAMGLRRAVANEHQLKAGSDPLGALGGAMQKIVTEYRLKYSRQTVQ